MLMRMSSKKTGSPGEGGGPDGAFALAFEPFVVVLDERFGGFCGVGGPGFAGDAPGVTFALFGLKLDL
jgi:hypothetical protein